MKKQIFPLIIFGMVALFLAITGCKKDEGSDDDSGSASTAEPSNPSPTPSDADGVLIAIETVTYQSQPFVGTIEIPIGLSVAVFPSLTNAFNDAGTVTCESTVLTKQNNNSYTSTPSQADPTGISFGSTIDWDVAGSTTVPAFNKGVSGAFPENLELTVANNDNVSTSMAFTLDTKNAITNADSVIFGVYGPDGALVVTATGSSHTFSAADMGTVGTGTGFVQVAAYRVAETETLGTGEVIYYLNEKVNTTIVNFQ